MFSLAPCVGVFRSLNYSLCTPLQHTATHCNTCSVYQCLYPARCVAVFHSFFLSISHPVPQHAVCLRVTCRTCSVFQCSFLSTQPYRTVDMIQSHSESGVEHVLPCSLRGYLSAAPFFFLSSFNTHPHRGCDAAAHAQHFLSHPESVLQEKVLCM